MRAFWRRRSIRQATSRAWSFGRGRNRTSFSVATLDDLLARHRGAVYRAALVWTALDDRALPPYRSGLHLRPCENAAAVIQSKSSLRCNENGRLERALLGLCDGFTYPCKGGPALFLAIGEPVLRPRIGKGGVEFSVLQSYFQSYLPRIGHRRFKIRSCGD
jgi:hypothetical protein